MISMRRSFKMSGMTYVPYGTTECTQLICAIFPSFEQNIRILVSFELYYSEL